MTLPPHCFRIQTPSRLKALLEPFDAGCFTVSCRFKQG
jgi:hypothetical protein